MKTTEILKNEAPNRCTKHLVMKSAKQFVAALASVFVVLSAAPSAPAQALVNVMITSCVPDMTIYLLTAPLTPVQRQALHAQNFNELPPSARAYYLHAVAYAAGLAVASGSFKPEHGTALRQHMENVIISSLNGEQGTISIYTAPSIRSQYSQPLAAHMAAVKTALQELNLGIAGAVANNSSYQQAMYAGAVCSFETLGDLSCFLDTSLD